MIDFAKARRNMVDCQVRPADVTHRDVLAAMDTVERERFLPDAARPVAYLDREVDVGEGRLLLTPMLLARLVQALDVKKTDRVLDVACGLGYSTAILAELAGEAVGVDSASALVAQASARLGAAGVTNARIVASPLDKPPAGASFDAILVNGAVETIPQAWMDALADGGRLACVRGSGRAARAVLRTRNGATYGERVLFDAAAPVLRELAAKPEFAF